MRERLEDSGGPIIGDGTLRERRWYQLSRYTVREIAIAVVAGVLLAALGSAWGAWKFVGDRSECPSVPVNLDGPNYSGPRLNLSVHVTCSAPHGQEYILIVELLNTGYENPHSEYYPRLTLSLKKEGLLSYGVDTSKSVVGSRRKIYVVSVTKDQKMLLSHSDIGGGGLIEIPDLIVVSNTIVSQRKF